MSSEHGAEFVSWQGRICLYTAPSADDLRNYALPLITTTLHFDLVFLQLTASSSAQLPALGPLKKLWHEAHVFVSADQDLPVGRSKKLLQRLGLVAGGNFPPVVGQRSIVTLWGTTPLVWAGPPLCCKTLVSGVLARRPGTVLELFPTQGRFGAHAVTAGSKVTVVAINPKPELEDRLKEAALALPRPYPT